jgi:hypothetical protein
MGASAASDAASAQEDAANKATNAQLQMFNTQNAQQAPYRNAGYSALNDLLYGLGLPASGSSGASGSGVTPLTYDQWAAQQGSTNFAPTGVTNLFGNPTFTYGNGYNLQPSGSSATQQGYQNYLNGLNSGSSTAGNSGYGTGSGITQGQFTHQFDANDLGTNLSPSYNFMLQQGLGSLQNSQAAQGGLVSGNALRGINDYAQNYASTGYQQAYNNYNTNQSNIFNRLSSIAGLGQTANQQSSSLAGTLAPSVANTIQGAGQAAASGIVGSNNALTGGLNNAMGWYQLSNMGNTASTPYYNYAGA